LVFTSREKLGFQLTTKKGKGEFAARLITLTAGWGIGTKFSRKKNL
jgi:hypothetical protein